MDPSPKPLKSPSAKNYGGHPIVEDIRTSDPRKQRLPHDAHRLVSASPPNHHPSSHPKGYPKPSPQFKPPSGSPGELEPIHAKLSYWSNPKPKPRSKTLDALEIILGGIVTWSIIWLHHNKYSRIITKALAHDIRLYILALAMYAAIWLVNVLRAPHLWRSLGAVVVAIAHVVLCVVGLEATVNFLIVGGFVSLLLVKVLRTS